MVDIKESMTVSADCQDDEEMETTPVLILSDEDLSIGHITKNKSSENDEFLDAIDELPELSNAKNHEENCKNLSLSVELSK